MDQFEANAVRAFVAGALFSACMDQSQRIFKDAIIQPGNEAPFGFELIAASGFLGLQVAGLRLSIKVEVKDQG